MSNREKLIELIGKYIREFTGNDIQCTLADYLIANGVVIREKGEWEIYWDNDYLQYCHKCSKCQSNAPTKPETIHDEILTDFCPNCGSDMRGGTLNG